MKKLIILLALVFCLNAKAQIITTFAGKGFCCGYSGDGGQATDAGLGNPFGIAMDMNGNLYIADCGIPNRLRKVNTAGIISTIAGTGIAGYSGDGGLATAAELNYADKVAVDSPGNIY